MLHSFPVYRHAVATTPVELLGASIVLLPQQRRPSPNFRRVGFHITLFEACSAFTARYGLSTRRIPNGPSTLKASVISLPPRLFQLLPAGTIITGWELHPLRIGTFSRRTEILGLVVG